MGWFKDDTSVYIAMEYFPLGDLYNTAKSMPPVAETSVRSILRQLLKD